MSEFAKLLGDLEEFQKAAKPACDEPDGDDKGKSKAKADGKADDKKIEAAAADGEKEGDQDKDGEPFGKAFKIKLEDGTETEAFDGTAMLKALHTENEVLRATINDQNQDLMKAMEIVVGELGKLRAADAERGTLMKALQTRFDALTTAGTGRRTMLTIAEKLTPMQGTPSAGAAHVDDKPTPGQVMMKAQFMAREGKLPIGQTVRIEAYQGRGILAPPDLLARYPELLTPIA
jgi:hypothetical protein